MRFSIAAAIVVFPFLAAASRVVQILKCVHPDSKARRRRQNGMLQMLPSFALTLPTYNRTSPVV